MKISNIISAFFLVLLIASCEGQLDIEPQQSISDDSALATAANVRNVLLGGYDFARNDLYGGRLNVYVDLLGNTDQTDWNGTFANLRDLFFKEMVVDNASALNLYSDAYIIIGIANTVLENLDKFDDATERETVEGEALFLRGLIYFDMARFFGPQYEAGGGNTADAVPIVLDAPDAERKLPRSSVTEVYAQALADLNSAYQKLPADNGVFADRYAAQAVLARVHLQMGNYASARDAANDVITNSGHSLEAAYADIFDTDGTSDESLMSFIINVQEGNNFGVTHYASQPLGGRGGDILITQAYLDRFTSANDVRATFNYDNGGLRLTSKYTRQFANVSLVRLGEMYLVRAEANLREGTNTGATPLEDVNAIRARANADALVAVTIDDILLERELELAFEGVVLHDYRRTQRSIGGLPYNDNNLLMPIPQSARDRNELLTQNPGY